MSGPAAESPEWRGSRTLGLGAADAGVGLGEGSDFPKAYEYEPPPGIAPERVGEYFNRYGTKVFKHVVDVDWGDPYQALLDEADRWAKIYNEYLYNYLEALQSAGRQVAPGDGRCRSALMTRAAGAETGSLRLSLGLGSMK